ncbi:hypothetical protein ES288_D08G307800v1 [Gossypium darwinii]|uniref:AP2/ERF domain-containing protein n=1 Tax=Gossypium darwinii TaxID=34276 RepID=A0A5D2BQ81_GOSDA|nr:hypothetical protein ES288_D08G307800v1 [Gossypium darwinii]
MMKPTSPVEHVSNSGSSSKYKGVRKRKWGKWVSEIRLPNSRERIWLGSYDSAEKAAKAFDVALYCLRGPEANFNFPKSPPEIVGGRSLTPPEIRAVAARLANQVDDQDGADNNNDNNDSSNDNYVRKEQCTSSSSGAGPLQAEGSHEMGWLPFLSMDTDNQWMSDSRLYSPVSRILSYGGDQLFPPSPPIGPPPIDDNADEYQYCGDGFSPSSSLWDF